MDRMGIIRKSINKKCWRGCGEKGTLLHCWWECKLIQPLWRTVWTFLKKLKIELPYDPAIPLLGIYPEKTIIQKELCTTLFIAALFTIVRSWKQPKCPSTEEWIKKLWWECKLLQPLWKTVWRFLKKLKIELPYDPAIPLLGIYPERMQTLI